MLEEDLLPCEKQILCRHTRMRVSGHVYWLCDLWHATCLLGAPVFSYLTEGLEALHGSYQP